MKELKFRAYDPDSGTFIYSDKEYDDAGFSFRDGKLVAYKMVEKAGSIYEPPCAEPVELEDPELFTGLLDCNGKEIYEGDIVDAYHNAYHRRGEIIYIENCCGVMASFCTKDNMGFLQISETPDIKVIGNIHENPELLESE